MGRCPNDHVLVQNRTEEKRCEQRRLFITKGSAFSFFFSLFSFYCITLRRHLAKASHPIQTPFSITNCQLSLQWPTLFHASQVLLKLPNMCKALKPRERPCLATHLITADRSGGVLSLL